MRMNRLALGLGVAGLLSCGAVGLGGSTAAGNLHRACVRPAAGSTVAEPEELRSTNGVLRAELRYRKIVDENGRARYCYLSADGSEAPNLRVKPGDTVILSLKNEMVDAPEQASSMSMKSMAMNMSSGMGMANSGMPVSNACASPVMTPLSTNLHFHGFSIPPTCHQDDVLKTMIQPGDPPFEYHFQVPVDQPAGLYWYHPHIHGFTSPQVLGGASGALIVEGIERSAPELAGLPERVFVIRDQDLVNPNAEPVKTDSMPPPIALRDAEGDILNSGTGTGKPAKDLSINFVPVAYPEYRPAVIATKPSQRQLWRVLNASAITYLDLQVLVNGKAELVGVVSLDGVPINYNGQNGQSGGDTNRVLWQSHVLMPPAGRVEFIFKGVLENARASLVTRSVDTGPAGENDPTRPLATIVAATDAPEPRLHLAASPVPQPAPTSTWIGNAMPVRVRKLYFSERPQDPSNPNGPTSFFITVDGQTPAVFDPSSGMPNIIAHQGDVEDWIIENRSQELHAFHIHPIHFMLVDWNGVPVDEPFLRDTINVPYWDGKSPQFPSVKLRMDFRDPNTVGTFPYHCHLLEHEDGGMMGLIRVEPAAAEH
ncbi:MAG TPA: multicopper oxidase domain-containing protein [Candidatus Acidoferrales bacterium]|nr:multicopper oxidase domain-containing protein [Candidatus Acidoferrales bacterium]